LRCNSNRCLFSSLANVGLGVEDVTSLASHVVSLSVVAYEVCGGWLLHCNVDWDVRLILRARGNAHLQRGLNNFNGSLDGTASKFWEIAHLLALIEMEVSWTLNLWVGGRGRDGL